MCDENLKIWKFENHEILKIWKFWNFENHENLKIMKIWCAICVLEQFCYTLTPTHRARYIFALGLD